MSDPVPCDAKCQHIPATPVNPSRRLSQISLSMASVTMDPSIIPPQMETENSCRCSMEALQILEELRSVHTVVELETILDLVQRVYGQGQAMLNCQDCRISPPQSSSLLTIPALAEQCLSLFEAVCSAYSITCKNCLFDPNILAFEQPLPQFICIRSKVQLGETELDEAETGMLVRTLLNRNSARLFGLLETLQGALRALSTDASQSHRAGTATLRAYESSVQSTMHRFRTFMEQMQVEQGT
ncbi:hypothetical protein BDV23DRAFT_189297 [Aspergillus alliaceus]|uniref:Uncharacterized protein n=1 Tax=Petromyces alliaceus TaxID=209559 RepID=A0A5N7BRY6_PETAA|nr:hypothetical protein BDV23DRAFT_189297 [Aspergillus alliaceus]